MEEKRNHRLKFTVEYDGTPFYGWQRQHDFISVQQVIEEALAAFCGETPSVFAAGRTDTGVHAEGQVCHVDMPARFSPFRVQEAANAHLRRYPVRIIRAEAVSDHFDARFSAVQRAYRYDILCRRAPSALLQNRVWHVPVALDIAAMRAAARYLEGRHNFTSFRDSHCQARSPVKTVGSIEITARPAHGGEGHIYSIHVSALSFLHHMIRIIAGTLADVGKGRLTPEDIPRILAAERRAAAGATAPAGGLYFTRAEYPPEESA